MGDTTDMAVGPLDGALLGEIVGAFEGDIVGRTVYKHIQSVQKCYL